MLDATEFSLPTVDEQLGFYQVAKNYYLPGWHQPSTNQFLYVNLDVWNALQPETRSLIETACMAGNAYAIAKAEALQGAVLKRFEAEGVKLHIYHDDVLEAFYGATQTVMKRKSAEDAAVRQGLRLDDGLPEGARALEGTRLPAAQLDARERLRQEPVVRTDRRAPAVAAGAVPE